jgi:hypothetical protein
LRSDCYYAQFINEETEAQSSLATCPRSQSWDLAELKFSPDLADYRPVSILNDNLHLPRRKESS